MPTPLRLPARDTTRRGTNGHLPRRPLRAAITAASTRLTKRRIRSADAEKWHDEAWQLYDQVGELRFVANQHANAMSQARWVAAVVDPAGHDPVPVDVEDDRDGTPPDPIDVAAAEAVAALGGGPLGLAEITRRNALHLFVPGVGYIVGCRHGVLDVGGGPVDTPADLPPQGDDGQLDIRELDWHAFSSSEVSIVGGELRIDVGDGRRPRTVPLDEAVVIRVWRPHPRMWWQADSPTRSNLPILRELVGLTKHVAASIDSRLAGNGLLIVPNSIEVTGVENDGEPDTRDPDLIDVLIDAASTAIKDRDSASALVPIVAKVPDGAVESVRHISFDRPFDEHARELRDEAIRRLALGLDAEPETLLGMSSANHWTGWLLAESSVKVHIVPALSLQADAFTRDYLWPVLDEAGFDPDEVRRRVVWFTTENLTLRPDRSDDARTLASMGKLSDAALRREHGFGEDDAPPAGLGPVEDALVQIIKGAPNVVGGNLDVVDALYGLLRDLYEGRDPGPLTRPTTDDDSDDDGEGGGRGVPDTLDDGPDETEPRV